MAATEAGPVEMERSERLVEWSYRLSLAFKAALGALQLIGGFGLVLAPKGAVLQLVDWMTRNELAQDPTDPIAHAAVAWAAKLSVSAEHFYAIYLLGHGCLNLGVAAALLFRVRGAYHVSLIVLEGFVAYQLYLFTQRHDPMLLVLTAIDVAVIVLVLLERRQTRRHPPG